MKSILFAAAALVTAAGAAQSQAREPADRPRIYAVPYAHLDTQWLWDYRASIDEYLPATMRENFALIEKYPGYLFNFTGANRYRMIKEYYPADYERIKRYVAAGRWFPAGSSMEEGDVNLPSPEAIFRQILLGSEFFRQELGVTSAEYFLPDSFGFPWSLPSILAHAGIRGFSTAKLTWGSSVPDQPSTPTGFGGKGVPFNLGVWVGPDGQGVVSALNPGDYIKHIAFDLSSAAAIDSSSVPPRRWIDRLAENRRKLGVAADYLYVGNGDIGGSPNEGTVAWLERAAANPAGAIEVVAGRADRLFQDLTADQIAALPRYAGEMELTNHSAGVLTSQAYHKRWMHRNEVLADAAERISAGVSLVGGLPYPADRLREAWTLMLAGHFHDVAAGTASPDAHSLSWNDALIASNVLAGVVTDGASAMAAQLETATTGIPLVAYNPLEIAREDAVEATVTFPTRVPRGVRVRDAEGRPVPAQLTPVDARTARIVFVGKLPPAGYAVFDVQPDSSPRPTELVVTDRSLENRRYRVRLDERGDIASIVDKQLGKELLAGPIRLAIKTHRPTEFPAWNLDWADERRPPRAFVGAAGTARARITERGPARIALTVTRTLGRSRFEQTVRLAAGDGGNRVEIGQVIDWRESAAALKALIPTSADADSATYNVGIGTIRRGIANPRKFEVPTHQWIDLTDRRQAYGVTILTGDKHGSDRPDRRTIGVTLILTPAVSGQGRLYPHQATQDWGHHEITFGLAGHAGDWRAGETDWQALRLDSPPLVFTTSRHSGRLGRTWSLVRSSSSRVRILAIKRAERGDELVVRLVETDGRSQPGVRLTFPAEITSAREVTGQEQPLPGAVPTDGPTLSTDLAPFQIRSFAIRLARLDGSSPTAFEPVPLAYDRAVASRDGERVVEGFDRANRAIPAELLPARIELDGIELTLGPNDGPNALVARGQSIQLPKGDFDRVYLLAAAEDGDQRASFRLGTRADTVTIQGWSGFVGQWDTRLWTRVPLPAAEAKFWAGIKTQATAQFEGEIKEVAAVSGDTALARAGVVRSTRLLNRQLASLDLRFAGLAPGFVKRARIAWFASHRHDAAGANESYRYSYLYAYAFDRPAGALTLDLPDNDRIRILAVTVARAHPALEAANPLYDTLGRAR